MSLIEKCPLCHHKSRKFFEDYFHCNVCGAVFLSKTKHPSRLEEKARYETHNNDVEDENYQKFVSPITNSICGDFTPEAKGLDFGAGTGPVISRILRARGYNIQIYDPFFHDYPELLDDKYDYIACCEVTEHFHHPDREFRLLANLLKPAGKLYCMTEIYNPDIDFASWYYKNDPTHVFFYQIKTFAWIKENYPFSSLEIEKRLVTLQKT